MKTLLLCIGKLHSAQVQQLVDEYSTRTARYWPFELAVVPDVRMPRPDAAAQKETEGTRILGLLAPGDYVVLMDERGRSYTSRAFADFISHRQVAGTKRLVFVIGGPYGFSQDVYRRADSMLSLSAMTLPHELARLFTVEQLYRAATIQRGEPYHHD